VLYYERGSERAIWVNGCEEFKVLDNEKREAHVSCVFLRREAYFMSVISFKVLISAKSAK
jgi:hypothetical protein